MCAQYARLRGQLHAAQLAQETSPARARPLFFSAAYELLALAVNGKPNPSLPTAVASGTVSAVVVGGWRPRGAG